MTRVVVMALCLMTACAAPRKLSVKLSKPHHSDDPEYLNALKERNYWLAWKIAERKGLGNDVVRAAVLADMWWTIDVYRSAFGAKRVAEEAGLTKAAMTTFAQGAFDKVIAESDCPLAADISEIFGLGRMSMDAAVSCEVSRRGVRHGLILACEKNASHETIRPLEERFVARFGIELADDPTGAKVRRVLTACRFSAENYLRMYEKLLADGNYDLSVDLLFEARRSGAILPIQKLWRRLFRAAATDGKLEFAVNILEQPDFEKTDEDALLLIDESLKRFDCVRAFRIAYLYSLGQETMKKIFEAPRCATSSFCLDHERVTDIIQGDDELDRYFRLALKYRKFEFAWELARRIPPDPSRYGPRGPKHMVIEQAQKAGAYSILIGFRPPRGVSIREFRSKILDLALDAKEEWFVASYADGLVLESKAPWVERAFLRAMERGEYVMAAQIAKQFGEAGRLETRGTMAFEMAMRAEHPGDARAIMRTCGIATPERADRVARMFYEQKRAAARKARLEKRRKERKKCRESGKWSVRCD